MTTETEISPELEAKINALVAKRFAELVEAQSRTLSATNATGKSKRRRLALVASKGTLDMAYPPLILASSAAVMGWEVGVFFTFYGLDIVNRKKKDHLQVAPLGNPAMPVPVPNLLGAIPGMTAMATKMMKGWMDEAKMPSIDELMEVCRSGGVRLIACSTTMGVMKVDASDVLDGVEVGGAAAFLDFAADAEVNLFI